MDTGVFPIDFQVDHRFWCTRTGRNVLFQRPFRMIAQGVIMRSAFLSPKEYRDFAAQCLRWAARAKRQEHKNMMLQMADHWMRTAQKLERADTYRCVPSGARLASTSTPRGDAREEPWEDDFKGASR
jgi:hypothetical protein